MAENLIRIRVALLGQDRRLLASPMAECGSDPSVFVQGGSLDVVILARDLADPKMIAEAIRAGGVKIRIGKRVLSPINARKDDDGDWVLSVILVGDGGGQ